MEIYLTEKFKKVYRRLPERIKRKAETKEEIFKENPFRSSLKTHLLHGIYKDYWAFSVDRHYRVVFQFLNATKSKVAFINIGTHEIYK